MEPYLLEYFFEYEYFLRYFLKEPYSLEYFFEYECELPYFYGKWCMRFPFVCVNESKKKKYIYCCVHQINHPRD